MLAMLLQSEGEQNAGAAGDVPVQPVDASQQAGAAAAAAGDAAAGALPVPAEDTSEVDTPGDIVDTPGEVVENSPVGKAGAVVDDLASGLHATSQRIAPRGREGLQIAGISVVELGLAVVVLLLTFVIRWTLERITDLIVSRRIDLRLLNYVVLLGGLFVALSMVQLPTAPFNWSELAHRVYLTLLIVFGVMAALRIALIILSLVTNARSERIGFVDRQLEHLLRDLTRGLAVIVAIILIVEAWGYNAGALVAGVGIGGLAIAFAAQDAIANILGSLVLYSDRPYRIGDWVLVDGAEGIVEEIGIRSTRIRTFDKQMIIVPNRKVVEGQIRNNSRMTQRRIRFRLGVVYDTTPDMLERTATELRELLAATPGVEQQGLIVALESFGDWSQNYLIQCYTNILEYERFMAFQQGVLLDIRRKLDELGVDMAFPTQVEIDMTPKLAAAVRGSGDVKAPD
jgi:MscS family membrane protein